VEQGADGAKSLRFLFSPQYLNIVQKNEMTCPFYWLVLKVLRVKPCFGMEKIVILPKAVLLFIY
jgi:hypothetical protein